MPDKQPAGERALNAARKAWGDSWTPELIARAPGRLELLGNHVDYNGGKVLASAIDRDVVALVEPIEHSFIEVVLADRGSSIERLDPANLHDWTRPNTSLRPLDYVRGAIAGVAQTGTLRRGGLRLAIAGDIPIGFGLSSSAALCVALCQALSDPVLTARDLVLAAQSAETRAGIPCGTLDQSASVGGDIIVFDGSNTSWESVSPDLTGHVFAVADSGVHRSLASSSYPTRVRESRQALEIINAELGTSCASLAALRDDDISQALAIPDSTLSATLKKRVQHIASETRRVSTGLDAAKRAEWQTFGELMSQAGRSSALDYEISHPIVEELVAISQTVPGVLGARMMGGGEGGTALVLLREDAIANLRSVLDAGFYASRGRAAADALRVFGIGAGASISEY